MDPHHQNTSRHLQTRAETKPQWRPLLFPLPQLPSSPHLTPLYLATSPTNHTSLLSCHIPCQCRRKGTPLASRGVGLSVRALTLNFSGSFFEEGKNDEDDGGLGTGPSAAAAVSAVVDKEEPQCPPELRQYETMAELRPDMSVDERLGFTQRYEELLVTGGGMYIEVFNRGVIPLAYSIKMKNKAGETNTYLDGIIYLLFTYFTKPESMAILETRLKADDDVIRSSGFKIRKRKY